MKNDHQSSYGTCLYYSANALARAITKLAEDHFGEIGLSPSYAFLLMSAQNNPGIQPKELSHEMQLTPSTVTRLVEKMEARNLLIRHSEGKITRVYPTEKCTETIPKIKECWAKLHDQYTSLLGQEASKELTSKAFEAIERLKC